jgi:hypothetical protein
MHFSRIDQPQLLSAAMKLTGSHGWRSDATAWGIYDSPGADLVGVAVFQNIDIHGAANLTGANINNFSIRYRIAR